MYSQIEIKVYVQALPKLTPKLLSSPWERISYWCRPPPELHVPKARSVYYTMCRQYADRLFGVNAATLFCWEINECIHVEWDREGWGDQWNSVVQMGKQTTLVGIFSAGKALCCQFFTQGKQYCTSVQGSVYTCAGSPMDVFWDTGASQMQPLFPNMT